MGVKGLQTFMEKYPAMFQLVDIAKMVADYWESHPDAISNPVIVVDGNNCLHQGLGQNFCENQLDWICGGQWDEYLKALEDFMAAFERIGVKLVFFFDGLIPMNNIQKWVSRRYQNVSDVNTVFEQIKAMLPVAPNIYTVAPVLSYALRAALKHVFHATVYCTVAEECDHALASFAATHQCMAILAQDSDYIIYPTVPYISMLHLDLNTMHSRIYCRKALCQEVGLEECMLPLFACMVATDDITRESLAGFHKRISANKFIKGLPRIHTTVRCVAEYISKNIGSNQSDWVRRIPEIYKCMGFGRGNATSFDKFKAALKSYSLDSTEIDGFIYPETKQLEDENVENDYEIILRKVKNGELLPTILNVICSGREMLSPSLEDAHADEKLPPYVIVYRPVRQRMYGLIFELKENNFEKHSMIPHTGALLPIANTVEEWWINPSHNAKDYKDIVTPLTVQLPEGISHATVLHDIIMENDEDLVEKKWAVFRACLTLTTSDSKFQSLPHQHKSLCAILNYLIQQPNLKLKLWEVEAFIIQAIHPKFEDTDSHMQLQLCPYNSRAVHLATLFLRGADIIFDLLWLCGNPIEMEYLMPWKFFNGKFFHHFYKDMHMSGGDRVELSGDHLAKFQLIKGATLEGIDVRACFR